MVNTLSNIMIFNCNSIISCPSRKSELRCFLKKHNVFIYNDFDYSRVRWSDFRDCVDIELMHESHEFALPADVDKGVDTLNHAISSAVS